MDMGAWVDQPASNRHQGISNHHADSIAIMMSCESYKSSSRRVSQTRALLSACRERAVDYNTMPDVLYVFERKI